MCFVLKQETVSLAKLTEKANCSKPLNKNVAPSLLNDKNIVTLSPNQSKNSNPILVRRISTPNMNCKAKPQSTGRHFI